MLRLLPYVIIVLATVMFSRVMSFINGEDWFETHDIHAASENQSAKDDNTKDSTNTTNADSTVSSMQNSMDGVNTQQIQQNTKPNAEASSRDVSTTSSSNDVSKKVNEAQVANFVTKDQGFSVRTTIAKSAKDTACASGFSENEVMILQALRKRREELEIRSEEVLVKESILNVLRQSVAEKVEKLEKIRAEVARLIEQRNAGNSGTTTKLVKIYENMNPKEAAKVFNELQLNVLLEVAQSMKEIKLASIIAEMAPEKARELTIALSNKDLLYNIYQ